MYNPLMLREAGLVDEPVLQGLAKKYIEPWYGDQTLKVREWLEGKDGRTTYLYSVEEEIAAWLVLRPLADEPVLHISSLCVVEKHRNKKIGAALLRFAVDTCIERERKLLSVTVAAENDYALRFFMYNGFYEQQRKYGLYRPDSYEIILRKQL